MHKKFTLDTPKIAVSIVVLAVSGCTNLPERKPLHYLDVTQVDPAYVQVFCDVDDHGLKPVCKRLSFKTPQTELSVVSHQKPAVDFAAILKNEPVAVVNFDFNESILKEDEKQRLVRVLGGKYHGATLYLKGYTDNVGTAPYNTVLAMKRADAVKKYLVLQGLPSESLDALGFGLCCYVADNKAADGRERNRRVEVYIGDVR